MKLTQYKEQCRFQVIRFAHGWVVWDRLRHRVSDGIYAQDAKVLADDVANYFNIDPTSGDRDWFLERGWKRF